MPGVILSVKVILSSAWSTPLILSDSQYPWWFLKNIFANTYQFKLIVKWLGDNLKGVLGTLSWK